MLIFCDSYDWHSHTILTANGLILHYEVTNWNRGADCEHSIVPSPVNCNTTSPMSKDLATLLHISCPTGGKRLTLPDLLLLCIKRLNCILATSSRLLAAQLQDSLYLSYKPDVRSPGSNHTSTYSETQESPGIVKCMDWVCLHAMLRIILTGRSQTFTYQSNYLISRVCLQ